jgi:hypothetical protein
MVGAPSDFRNGSILPANLGTTWVDEETVNQLVQSYVGACESGLDLEYPTWLLWVARDAHLDTAAAIYGSSLEALRRTFLRQAGRGATKLIDSSVEGFLISSLKETLRTKIDELPQGMVSEEVARILLNKLDQLGDRSSSMQYPEFFKRLRLAIGRLEIDALKERNLPAHGHRYRDEDYARLSKIVDVFRTLIHRVILRLSGVELPYVDYATLGHPQRHLEECCGASDEVADEDASGSAT